MTRPWWTWALVIAAGSAGSLVRYAVVSLTPSTPRPGSFWSRWFHGVWPTGVLVANTVASFLVGLVAALPPTAAGRLVLAVGFGGGLSTLSTLAVDSVSLWRHGRRGAAVANLLVTVLAGLAAAVIGAWVGRIVGVGPRSS